MLVGLAATVVRWGTARARNEGEQLQFEEEGVPALLELGLYRDGAMTGNPPPDGSAG